jgi:hypothetical protein
MQVDGQELDESAVEAFLVLVKAALTSETDQEEYERMVRHPLFRRNQVIQEWVAVMQEGKRLFGLLEVEP